MSKDFVTLSIQQVTVPVDPDNPDSSRSRRELRVMLHDGGEKCPVDLLLTEVSAAEGGLVGFVFRSLEGEPVCPIPPVGEADAAVIQRLIDVTLARYNVEIIHRVQYAAALVEHETAFLRNAKS